MSTTTTADHPSDTRRGRRRRTLRWTALITAAVLVVATAVLAISWQAIVTSNVGDDAFDRPLAIPPLAPSWVDADGVRRFDLRAQPGETELLPGVTSPTWGVNGSHLGPTLRAQRGEQVAVDVHNELPETTTMHWHGMKLPAVADGGPHSPIAPGTTWSPTWRVDQPAATLWYHPHPHGRTSAHVYRGVAGMFLVDEPGGPPLPERYGVDDVPVILQDKAIGDDGTLSEEVGASIGLLGTTVLVNGTHAPVFDARTSTVRLRVLNASVARFYDLALPDDREFTVIGTDSGLLPEPTRASRFQLAPGDRAEILVDLAPGEDTMLRSVPTDLGVGYFMGRLSGGDDSFDLLRLRAAPVLEPVAPLPARLSSEPDIAPTPGSAVRDFVFGGTSQINGREMDMSRIDHAVPLGATETWRFRTEGGIPHSVHIHNAVFTVLDVDGHPPPPPMRGRQDTVFLPDGATVRVAIAFGTYPDPSVPFMIHCHQLFHEDLGMMAQFVVVRPGERAGTPATGGAHHG